jgi:hypothetical protein
MKTSTFTALFLAIFLIFSNTALATTPEKDGETTPYETFLAAEKAAEMNFREEKEAPGFSRFVFPLINESIDKGYRDKRSLTNLLNRMDDFVIEGKTLYAEWLRDESDWYAKSSIRARFKINNLPD